MWARGTNQSNGARTRCSFLAKGPAFGRPLRARQPEAGVAFVTAHYDQRMSKGAKFTFVVMIIFAILAGLSLLVAAFGFIAGLSGLGIGALVAVVVFTFMTSSLNKSFKEMTGPQV